MQLNHKSEKSISGFFHFAGFRYWPGSLFPALVGTTLPFWLKPLNFTFKWWGAIEFLFLVILLHSSFSFLYAYFENKSTDRWTKTRLVWTGIFCLLLAVFLLIHINNNLQLNKYVNEYIFIIFGITAIFAGLLYVAPPFSFFKRVGGETFIYIGLGMVPVLGAYIIQAGDLTRSVYIASIPIVVSTALWLWLSEIISGEDDKKAGRNTMVLLFSSKLAGRFITSVLTISVYIALILAVIGRSSLNPLSLLALFSTGFAFRITNISWNNHSNKKLMLKARKYAALIHFVICLSIILSSLSTIILD